MYDYLIVSAGLYGATVTWELIDSGISSRNKEMAIYRWEYLHKENRGYQRPHIRCQPLPHKKQGSLGVRVALATFNRFTNCPVANYRGELYSLPFDMHTFNKIWGCTTPAEAKEIIEKQRTELTSGPQNLEEQTISFVGHEIYESSLRAKQRSSGGEKMQ